MSPLAEGLFHKAIAMSGVVPLEAHYTNNPLAMAKVLNIDAVNNTTTFDSQLIAHSAFLLQMIANLTECDNSDTKKLVECIKSKSEEDILNAIQQVSSSLFSTLHLCMLFVFKSLIFVSITMLLSWPFFQQKIASQIP